MLRATVNLPEAMERMVSAEGFEVAGNSETAACATVSVPVQVYPVEVASEVGFVLYDDAAPGYPPSPRGVE